jgi:hypothetical protein
MLLLAALTMISSCVESDGPEHLPAHRDAALDEDAYEDAGALRGGSFDAGMSARIPDAHTPVQQAADASDLPVDNESFETARAILLGDQYLQDVLHVAQSNFFVFEAPTAGFYELHTDVHDFSPDVALWLYDSERVLMAENDDGSLWPGDAIDARLVVRLPHPGRYYVKVSDMTTPPEFFAESAFSLLFYHVAVRAIAADAEGFVSAGDGAETVARFALDEESGYSYVTVLGILESSTVDTFVFAGLTDHALIGHLLRAGIPGHGSTAPAAQVRVLSEDKHLIASIDGSRGETQLFPPITSGQNAVTVAAPSTVGANGFYAIDLVMLPDNPREQLEATNGRLSSAEPIVTKGDWSRRGLLLSDVSLGDVDYFSLPLDEGETLLLSCEGQSAGSGVRQLHAELRDKRDKTVAVAVESEAHVLDIESWQVPASGPYYVRLSSDRAPAAEEAEPWVRCVVIVGH